MSLDEVKSPCLYRNLESNFKSGEVATCTHQSCKSYLLQVRQLGETAPQTVKRLGDKYRNAWSGKSINYEKAKELSGYNIASILEEKEVEEAADQYLRSDIADSLSYVTNLNGCLSMNTDMFVKKEDIMNQTIFNREDVTHLVDEYRSRKGKEFQDIYCHNVDVIKGRTQLGKLLNTFKANVQKINPENNVVMTATNFGFLFDTYLTEDEKGSLKLVRDMYDEQNRDLMKKCDEVRTLLLLADTFKEREALLKKYKIIGGK